jgi:hypothetical protein
MFDLILTYNHFDITNINISYLCKFPIMQFEICVENMCTLKLWLEVVYKKLQS